MGRYFTSGPWIFHGSSSMLAGSVMGVPGPVATMRPPWTCRLSSAVGGRYSPTLVRSSPSSGEINTRSPTTIRRLGVSSSRMGNSIRPTGKAVSPVCDADHRRRLTGRRRSLSMCPGRSGVRVRRRFPRPPIPVPTPVREHRHASTARHCADRAVELDSPDGVGLDLGGPVLDPRLAGAGVPHGALGCFLLADRGEVLVALLPGDGAGGGRLGHDGLALHHSVPLGPRTRSGRAANVLA